MKKIAFLLCCFMLLTGCETTKKIYTVITDSDVPVGYPDDLASELSISILADRDVNPNLSGEPTPIDIHLVFLSDDSLLNSTDYYQIATEPLEKILGKNYIDHQDFTLDPGAFKALSPMKVPPKTEYVAVIAHYLEAEDGEIIWSDIFKIEQNGNKYRLLIHIQPDIVEIKKS